MENHELPAGRELDRAVGKRVMGIEDRRVPEYSTNLLDAWKVIEKLNARGFWIRMESPSVRPEIQLIRSDGFQVAASGETPAHAICLAALKAASV